MSRTTLDWSRDPSSSGPYPSRIAVTDTSITRPQSAPDDDLRHMFQRLFAIVTDEWEECPPQPTVAECCDDEPIDRVSYNCTPEHRRMCWRRHLSERR